MNDPPEKLRDRPIWLIWKREERTDADGEPYQTKVPLDPHTGGSGDATDPDKRTDYDHAVRAQGNYPEADGIGFAFAAEGMLVGVDLDNVVDPETGELREWAAEVVETLDSYTEYSPSGTGLHVLVMAAKPGDKCRTGVADGECEIEIYDKNRFFTYTGEHFDGSPETVHPRNGSLSEVYNEYLGSGGSTTSDDADDVTLDPPDESDEDTSGYESLGWSLDDWRDADPDLDTLLKTANPAGHYKSTSEADFATVARLLHLEYGHNDIAAILRQYRSRDKMQRTDYVETTIKNASSKLAGTASEPEINPRRGASDKLTLWKLRHFAVADDVIAPYGFVMQDPEDGDEYLGFNESVFDRTIGALDDAGIEHGREQVGDEPQEPDEGEGESGYEPDPWAYPVELYNSDDSDNGEAHYHAAKTARQQTPIVTERETGETLVYDGETGIFETDGEMVIQRMLVENLKTFYRTKRQREIMAHIAGHTERPIETIGGPKNLVCVGNGVLDLSALPGGEVERKDHNPEYRFLRALPVEYDPDAECSQFREFVDDVVRPQDLKTLQEYAGYCLCHWGQPYKRAAILLGPQDSGKSTFLNVILGLLGQQNVSSENLDALVNSRWGTAEIYRKLANITNELDTNALETVGTFKTLVGGDGQLTAERKGQNKFQFQPTAKHLFAANRVPPAKGADDAFHERWLHIRFPETIPKHEQVRDLDEKLLDELPGVLNWAIEGYERLLEQDGFSNDPIVGDKRDMWEAYGNSIKRFKHSGLQITGDSEDVIVKKIAHTGYATFCNQIGTEVETQNQFTRTLTDDKNIGDARRTVRSKGKQRPVYTGIRFHSDLMDETDFDPGAELDKLRDDVTDDEPETTDTGLGGFGE